MKSKTQRLVVTSILLAIATVLSVLTVFRLPFGGSVTPASMMPIILISYIYGIKWGLFSGFVFGILQMVTGFDVVAALFMPGESKMLLWQAILICLIDYVFAYMMPGLGGVFKGKMKSRYTEIVLGTFFSLFLCYIMHVVSGFIFYGAWAEWFFTQEGFYSFGSVIVENFSGNSLSLFYSLIYNGLYMLPETVITAAVMPPVLKIASRQTDF